jgi:hypothetical protein
LENDNNLIEDNLNNNDKLIMKTTIATMKMIRKKLEEEL